MLLSFIFCKTVFSFTEKHHMLRINVCHFPYLILKRTYISKQTLYLTCKRIILKINKLTQSYIQSFGSRSKNCLKNQVYLTHHYGRWIRHSYVASILPEMLMYFKYMCSSLSCLFDIVKISQLYKVVYMCMIWSNH